MSLKTRNCSQKRHKHYNKIFPPVRADFESKLKISNVDNFYNINRYLRNQAEMICVTPCRLDCDTLVASTDVKLK